MIPNASCNECGQIEPQDWDAEVDGLWICQCVQNKPELIDGKKPIDYAVDKMNSKEQK